MRRARSAGFTLIEVMLALAVLALGLIVLVRSVATNVTTANSSFYLGVVTDLTRGKMYDLEEKLLDEGFQEDVQEEDGDFGEEGWPDITWQATIEPCELPSIDKMMALGQGQAGSEGGQGGEGGEGGSGEGGELSQDAVDKFQSSALGGMMSMFTGGAPMSAGDADTGAFMQLYYGMVQQVLKASIRKITLVVKWKAGVRKEEVKVVLYVTDPAGMQKTLQGLGQ